MVAKERDIGEGGSELHFGNGGGGFWLAVEEEEGCLMKILMVLVPLMVQYWMSVKGGNVFPCQVLGSSTLSFKGILSQFLSPVSHFLLG